MWCGGGLHWPKMWWVGRNVTGRLDLLGLHEINPSYELTKVSFTPGLAFKLQQAQLDRSLLISLAAVEVGRQPMLGDHLALEVED